MPEVGVRELKTRASEIVRDVRERRVRYTITHRGKPVGTLGPLEAAPRSEGPADGETGVTAWEALTELGAEIGEGWESPLTSTQLLSAIRR